MAESVSQPAHGFPVDNPSDHGGVYHNVHPWQRLKWLLKLESGELWVAVIYSAVMGLVTLVLPVATQSLVNTIAFSSRPTSMFIAYFWQM